MIYNEWIKIDNPNTIYTFLRYAAYDMVLIWYAYKY